MNRTIQFLNRTLEILRVHESDDSITQQNAWVFEITRIRRFDYATQCLEFRDYLSPIIQFLNRMPEISRSAHLTKQNAKKRPPIITHLENYLNNVRRIIAYNDTTTRCEAISRSSS